MFIVIILLAVNKVIGDEYPEDGRNSPFDFGGDPSFDHEDAYPSDLERTYGIKDPKYTNPILRQGGNQPSLRMPGEGGMPPGSPYSQYHGNSPRGPPMGPGGGMGAGGPMRPNMDTDGPPRFDYDIVSEVAKKYKDNPFVGGSAPSGVNDLYEFEEKLTFTGKWDEFLDEMERRKRTGDVPKDWQKDVEHWGAWIRNAMAEKIDADKKKNQPRPTGPRNPSPGMSPYWVDEEPKKMGRSGPGSNNQMMDGQTLLDKAIERLKGLSDSGGENSIPPQMPVDGSFIGDLPPQKPQKRPDDGDSSVGMPSQMQPMSQDEMVKRGMPQVNPAAISIGPGMRRPPPNMKWPEKGNIHGNRFGNVPPSLAGNGNPFQGNFGGNGYGNVPLPPNSPGNGNPYQGNFGGNGYGNVPPPPNLAGNGNPYQGNFGGNGYGNVPPPPNSARNGNPYQGNFGGNGYGNFPPPNSAGYSEYQSAGMPGPPGFDPRYGRSQQQPPNTAWQGDPSEMSEFRPNEPTGAEWLKVPSMMPFGGNKKLDEMVERVMMKPRIMPKPDPNYHSTIFKPNIQSAQPPNVDFPSQVQPNTQSAQPPNVDFPSQVQPNTQSAQPPNFDFPSQVPNTQSAQPPNYDYPSQVQPNTQSAQPPNFDFPSQVPNIQSAQPPNVNFQSKVQPDTQSLQPPNVDLPIPVTPLNDPPPRGPIKNWPKAIQYRKPPPPTNTTLGDNNKSSLPKDLPLMDDFRAPIRWVKFNSHDTQDGLAKVTDPKTGKNRQAKINGSLYVPVADRSIARLGYAVPTLPPSTEPPRMVSKEEAVLRTIKDNVDLEKIDERDWLVTAVTLGGAHENIECDGDTCQSRCHSLGCQTKCSGDTCSSGCVADSCTAFCKGPGCLAMCIGKDCNARCDGQSCDSRCRGEECEAKCKKFSCHFTVNGAFRIGGGTWDQNYPQYDSKHLPTPSYND